MNIFLKTVKPHSDTEAGFYFTLSVEGAHVSFAVKYDINDENNPVLRVSNTKGVSILEAVVDTDDNVRPFIEVTDQHALLMAQFSDSRINILRTKDGVVFDIWDKNEEHGVLGSKYLLIPKLLENADKNQGA